MRYRVLLPLFGLWGVAACGEDAPPVTPAWQVIPPRTVEPDRLPSSDADQIVQRTSELETGLPIAPPEPGTHRGSGFNFGLSSAGPRLMYSAAFGDTYLLSWMALDEDKPQTDNGYLHYGNVSTFNVADSGAVTAVSQVSFKDRCEAVYGIQASADGSVIGLLCKGYPAAALLPGTKDLLPTLPGNFIGTNWPEGSAIYLFEYTSDTDGTPAAITDNPDSIVLINHAAGGGWNYGHHELRLNAAKDTYYVALKTSSNDGEHQGMTHFGVRRPTGDSTDFAYTDLRWGCGPGHVIANRLAYNAAKDTWGLMCTLDWCRNPDDLGSFKCFSVSYGTIPGDAQPDPQTRSYSGTELFRFTTHDQPYKIVPNVLAAATGGMVSLGDDGLLGVTIQPETGEYGKAESDGDAPLPRRLAAIRLPIDAADYREEEAVWTRIAGHTEPGSPADTSSTGYPAIAHLGTQGEMSPRFLVGWSPRVNERSLARSFRVAQIDRDLNLIGAPLELVDAGWGEDNAWTTVPNSGCVVFASAWAPDTGPGGAYPNNRDDVSLFPTSLQVTTLCSGSSRP